MGVYCIGVYTCLDVVHLGGVAVCLPRLCLMLPTLEPQMRRRPTLFLGMTLGHSVVFASTPGTGTCLLLIYTDTRNTTALTHAELSASPMHALTCNG